MRLAWDWVALVDHALFDQSGRIHEAGRGTCFEPQICPHMSDPTFPQVFESVLALSSSMSHNF
jgi:hypothetical protein